MKFFKKKPEKPEAEAHAIAFNADYIDKLFTGDRKIPAAPARKTAGTKKLPFLPFFSAICFLLALLFFFFSLYLHKRQEAIPTDPETTTTALPTTEATEPPTEPTEPPLRFDEVTKGGITYLVPSETLELSLWQHYCTCPTLPIPEDDAPAEDWLLLFYSLLAEEDSWYHQALTSHYATPQEVNMEYLLCRGIAQGGSPLESYPEAQWLLEHSFLPGRNVIRLPASDIMSLESVYFGTVFEDHESLWYPYNRENACFYYYESNDYDTAVLGIVGYEWMESGDVCVQYVAEDYRPELMQVVLHPVDDYFQIVSNLPVPTEPVTIDLEDIPDVSGSVYEPGSMFVEPGYSGYAKWGESEEFSIELPLLEPFCEGAKAINEEIRSTFQAMIDEVKRSVTYQYSAGYWKVSYETYQSNDVLSIVISTRMSAGDNVGYTVYNLDLTTGQQLDQYEMIRRYTGMSYPEFLLRANYTVVDHLRKENPADSENVTNWLSGLGNDVWVMSGHKLILNTEGTLILLNHSVPGMAAGYLNVQIPFDPNACGEEFRDWERESYEWLFGIRTDGAYSTTKASVLQDTFFFDPERFLHYLSGMSDELLQNNAHLLPFEMYLDQEVQLLRQLCSQYLSQSDTAKAAQFILDWLEKLADN